MTDVLAVLLLALCVLTGLALVPVGLPGLWLMVVGLIAYGWLTDFRSVGAPVVAIVVALALVGEVLETWLGFRFARRHGGSSRSGFGALLGGLVGAIVGVPVPIVGSVIGAFIGAFVGAALAEYTLTRRTQVAASAGWGAVLGRAAAAAVKIGLGLAIGIVSLVAVLRG
jgi:uncharacterized protein YqgC (DUF456 family)